MPHSWQRHRRPLLVAVASCVLLVGGCGRATTQGTTAVSRSPTPTTPAQSREKQPQVPATAAIDRAVVYLERRDCDAALAVVDTHGDLHGYRMNQTFTSASVVKAMLLVQYLRTHDHFSDGMRASLSAMITRSDNDAAYRVYAVVGADGLRALAETADMTDFTPEPDLLSSRVTAADQARFFYAMDEYVPARHRLFARRLLSSISAHQTWGVAEVARPRWRVHFKSGWLGAESDPYTLVNQVARLERGELTWAVAVLSNDNPRSPYAFETLRGVTRQLLSGK